MSFVQNQGTSSSTGRLALLWKLGFALKVEFTDISGQSERPCKLELPYWNDFEMIGCMGWANVLRMRRRCTCAEKTPQTVFLANKDAAPSLLLLLMDDRTPVATVEAKSEAAWAAKYQLIVDIISSNLMQATRCCFVCGVEHIAQTTAFHPRCSDRHINHNPRKEPLFRGGPWLFAAPQARLEVAPIVSRYCSCSRVGRTMHCLCRSV
jgi:hypothetical protein